MACRTRVPRRGSRRADRSGSDDGAGARGSGDGRPETGGVARGDGRASGQDAPESRGTGRRILKLARQSRGRGPGARAGQGAHGRARGTPQRRSEPHSTDSQGGAGPSDGRRGNRRLATCSSCVSRSRARKPGPLPPRNERAGSRKPAGISRIGTRACRVSERNSRPQSNADRRNWVEAKRVLHSLFEERATLEEELRKAQEAARRESRAKSIAARVICESCGNESARRASACTNWSWKRHDCGDCVRRFANDSKRSGRKSSNRFSNGPTGRTAEHPMNGRMSWSRCART